MNFKEFATMIRGIKYSLSDTSVFEDDIPVEYCVGHRFEISLFIDGNGLNAKLNPIEDSNHPYIYYKDLLKQIEIVENNVVNTDDINISEIVDKIEKDLEEKFIDIIHVNIHVNPN